MERGLYGCFCNADYGGFFTTKGTKVFEVLRIKKIEAIKSEFGGFFMDGLGLLRASYGQLDGEVY
ncbi:hypothetical protein [Flavobacterium sp.]|jgi:hypothetical protein|uniref:hypothetical protein n=1 Tax=Flavobacterium sp. TaxID=239 RepID=UPI0037BEC841